MLRHTIVAQEITWKIVSKTGLKTKQNKTGLKHEGENENHGRHI